MQSGRGWAGLGFYCGDQTQTKDVVYVIFRTPSFEYCTVVLLILNIPTIFSSCRILYYSYSERERERGELQELLCSMVFN